MRPYKYFDLREFRSPDAEHSGSLMSHEFVSKLDKAREIAGIPFKINSGYRTREHNSHLIANGYKASPNSSHMKGIAADISAKTSGQKYVILIALLAVGFNRFGIGDTYIHVDMDPDKPANMIWTY